jgi:diacylglycerol kinase family enzyme
LAIVNPHSGGNRDGARLRRTLDQLRPVAERTVITDYAGHAFELASQAQAYGGVVAVGGDGTLFEILRGIDRDQQRVAIVPAGRGNSLARDLGLMNSSAISDLIHWDRARTIDLMEVRMTARTGAETSCYSVSTLALGYPAAVAQRARRMAMLGRMSYAAGSALVRPVPFATRVQYGDSAPAELRLTGLVANNTRHMANFLVFKKASLIDGLFEIMEMRAGYLKQSLHNLSALSRAFEYEPCFLTQTHSAQITLESPQHLLIDGEIFPDIVALDIRILPRALACNGLRVA